MMSFINLSLSPPQEASNQPTDAIQPGF